MLYKALFASAREVFSSFPFSFSMLPLLFLFISAVARAQTPEDYAPTTEINCPDVSTSPLLRTFTPSSQTLNSQESAYISGRRANVIPQQWSSWLGDGSGIGYNLSSFNASLPNVSLAFSGGGYRAAQYAAGVISAFDARNSSSKSAGTGGLVQVASYLSGLSGGSWFLVRTDVVLRERAHADTPYS